ncbi:MAG: hypothetical protein OXI87_18935 [Albidovulum sp.]|nr:hypothetical protein [Albidovulum sp.]
MEFQAAPLYGIRATTRHRLEDVPDGTETCTTEMVHDKSDPLRGIFTTRRTCAPTSGMPAFATAPRGAALRATETCPARAAAEFQGEAVVS